MVRKGDRYATLGRGLGQRSLLERKSVWVTLFCLSCVFSDSVFLFDHRTKAVMAQPTQDGIKEKVKNLLNSNSMWILRCSSCMIRERSGNILPLSPQLRRIRKISAVRTCTDLARMAKVLCCRHCCALRGAGDKSEWGGGGVTSKRGEVTSQE